MKIPSQIRAGDSATWKDDPTTDNLGNSISAPTWTLKYSLKQAAVALTLTATQDGDQWSTTISKAQSASFSAGIVYFQAYAENGTDRVTVGSGRIDVLQNIADATGTFDGRSQTQQDLEAVQAAMRAMISGGAVAEYSIGGRSLRKIPLADLIQLEGLLKSRLSREKKAESIANGLGNPSNIFVRFK